MANGKTMDHSTLLLLSLLSTEDMYGYQMIAELERRSENAFRMKEGTLYPILKKLENGGCLSTYSREISGRTRKYYHLTEHGAAVLKAEQEAWHSYARGINAVLGGMPLST